MEKLISYMSVAYGLNQDFWKIKKGYVRTRLQNNPVNFSTNPMANLMRLWDFEFYGEMIKEIDILLSKC